MLSKITLIRERKFVIKISGAGLNVRKHFISSVEYLQKMISSCGLNMHILKFDVGNPLGPPISDLLPQISYLQLLHLQFSYKLCTLFSALIESIREERFNLFEVLFVSFHIAIDDN